MTTIFRSHVFGLSLLMCSLFIGVSMAHAGKTVPVIPTQGKSVILLIGGKEQTYYALSKTASIRLEVDGPGKLVVTSRLSLSKTATGPERYGIKVREGKEEVKSFSTQTERSDAVFKGSNLPTGKIRKFNVKVPEGSHVYELLLENPSGPDAVLRFRFQAEKKRGDLVTVEALSYDKVVTAMVKEKLITYYVGSKDRKVQFRVVGPTRLKISARLNYDAKMKGEQKYTVLMWEGNTRVLMKPLATTKALGVIYQEWKDVSPGKVNSFYFDVPQGEHTYKFDLAETIAHSVALKFSIPKKDLGNEE